jgi:hypothetical protein
MTSSPGLSKNVVTTRELVDVITPKVLEVTSPHQEKPGIWLGLSIDIEFL